MGCGGNRRVKKQKNVRMKDWKKRNVIEKLSSLEGECCDNAPFIMAAAGQVPTNGFITVALALIVMLRFKAASLHPLQSHALYIPLVYIPAVELYGASFDGLWYRLLVRVNIIKHTNGRL